MRPTGERPKHVVPPSSQDREQTVHIRWNKTENKNAGTHSGSLAHAVCIRKVRNKQQQNTKHTETLKHNPKRQTNSSAYKTGKNTIQKMVQCVSDAEKKNTTA